MKLENAKVLVTGGSAGIGLATARMLRDHGAQVAICGRRGDVVTAAAKEIGALPLTGDVGKEDDARRLVAETIREFGEFDTLINNAGWGRFAKLDDLRVEDFLAVLETNVIGAMLMARESSRHFVTRGGGNIVNVSSTAGSRGFAGGTAYVASKFALGGMTQCWRAELRQHDIRVMQVNPSEVQTDFAAAGGRVQKLSERKLRSEDIAHAICGMLAMEDRGFTTELTVFATNPD
ncbi:MAG: SDR family oxidoreductase [bacterium]